MHSDKIPYAKELFMAFLGFSLWNIADAFIRSLNDYPTVLISCMASWTSTILLLCLSPYLGGVRDTLLRPQLKLRFFRGMVLACCNFSVYIALAHLDLATTYAVIFAAPFIAKVLSVLLTGENIRLHSWLITLLGFIGVLIVLRPGTAPFDIGFAAALFAAFFFALGFVLTRYIKAENQTMLSMGIFQYSIVAVLALIPALHAYNTMPPNMNIGLLQIISILCISSSGITGSILVSRAYSGAPTQVVAPVHYVQIIWGALLSAVFFSEYPDQWTIIGAAVIVISGILLIRHTRPIAEVNLEP
ncbi:MAG: EamA family transporter [Alphaproteobacteria bacterium]|nr:EamA family transporter [Alphaproteobacteria bacterium]